MKKKLLYYGDSLSASTGFGNVARHVLSRVADRYDITVFGINEFFLKPNKLPITIIPAIPNKTSDPYGRKKFIEFVLEKSSKFDIWFLQNDIHFWEILPELVYNVRTRGENPHIFTYTVIDSPVRAKDVRLISVADICGIPSMFGINEILKVEPNIKYKLRHIPHGIDTSEFYPIPSSIVNKFKKDNMNLDENTFLITNVNRNSIRKDIPRTLIYYKMLQEKCPNVRLYLHMEKNEENYRGYSLNRIIESNNIKIVGFPENFNVNQGLSVDVLNLIYNASDLVVSTTLGEGFGLSTIEAMATKTLVMMPDNTSISELLAGGRGIAIKCGESASDWIVCQHDLGFPRPIVNIDDMVEKTISIIHNYPDDVVDRAYNWVTSDLNWNRVVNLFIDGFENLSDNSSIEGSIFI